MGCEDIDCKQIQKRPWNDNGCRNTPRSDSASIMQLSLKDDGRMAKREGLAPCCILVANFYWNFSWWWGPDTHKVLEHSIARHYSTSYCEIDVMRFGPVDVPNTHLSKYRLTWSIVSTSYSKGSVASLDIFGCWIANLIGFRPESYKIHEGKPLSLGRLPSFFYTWDVRILEVKEDSFDANGHQYQFHGDREFAWEDGTIQTLESVDRTPANFLSLPSWFFFPTLKQFQFLVVHSAGRNVASWSTNHERSEWCRFRPLECRS